MRISVIILLAAGLLLSTVSPPAQAGWPFGKTEVKMDLLSKKVDNRFADLETNQMGLNDNLKNNKLDILSKLEKIELSISAKIGDISAQVAGYSRTENNQTSQSGSGNTNNDSSLMEKIFGGMEKVFGGLLALMSTICMGLIITLRMKDKPHGKDIDRLTSMHAERMRAKDVWIDNLIKSNNKHQAAKDRAEEKMVSMMLKYFLKRG